MTFTQNQIELAVKQGKAFIAAVDERERLCKQKIKQVIFNTPEDVAQGCSPVTVVTAVSMFSVGMDRIRIDKKAVRPSQAQIECVHCGDRRASGCCLSEDGKHSMVG